MAISIRVPNGGSQFTAAGCVPSSCDTDIWVGMVTPISSSGSVTFFRTASEVSGSILCSLVASPGQTVFLPYPINSPSGIFAGCISGGSVFFWTTR